MFALDILQYMNGEIIRYIKTPYTPEGKLSVERPPSGEANISPPIVMPTVAFCIPVSIETVVAFAASILKNLAV